MKFVAVMLLALAVTAHAGEFADIAAQVNAAGVSWTAHEGSRFSTLEQAKTLCGTWQKGHPSYVELNLPESTMPVLPTEALPTDFDARTQWANCTVISKVRDQSSCGSCWAFGSTETFEDRRCISTGDDIEYASEDTAACCSSFGCGFSQGCGGGQPSAALSWMTKTGVVTGGDFFDIGANTGCLPYSLKPCAHHVPATEKYPACPSSEYPTPSCSKSCSETGYGTAYADDKTKGSSAYSITSVDQMMTEIYTKGPVSVAFTVYADFPTYKSGVYKHTTGSQLGGHAVEAVGWGVDNGEDYWIIKNSWNEEWGDGGFFKIAKGTNECGIEDDVTGITF